MYTYFEGVNGVKRLATKGYKILLTTDKTSKKLPTSDKKINCDLPKTDKHLTKVENFNRTTDKVKKF